MIRKRSRLILSIIVPVVAFVILLTANRIRDARESRKVGELLNSWRAAPYIIITNTPEVERTVEMMIEQSPNAPLLTEIQRSKLRAVVIATLKAYSEGDFESYFKFRAPRGIEDHPVIMETSNRGGQGEVVWDMRQVRRLKSSLPSAEFVQKAIRSGTTMRPEVFEKYSTETAYDVAKFTWLIADETRNGTTKYKLFCTDCWEGFSPSGSWIRISESALSAESLAREEEHLGVSTSTPIMLLAPSVKSTLHAGLKLLMHTREPQNAYPIYIVYALTETSQCWIPVSMAKALEGGTKQYLF